MKATCKKLPSKKRKYAAAIGIFDGVHLGHQFILKKLIKEAGKNSLSPLVITFDTPPQQFLNKSSVLHGHRIRKRFFGYITNPGQKAKLFKSLGINNIWFLKTRHSLLKLPALDFINYIRKSFKIEEFIVGEDFRFGHGGHAGVNFLKKLSLKQGFKLQVIKKKSKDKKIISSSFIRELIKKGRIDKAGSFLGRRFSLEGKVFKGRGVGRKIGFPTANISTFDYVTPAEGVYAAWAVFENKIYPAAVNIGLRPTVVKARKPVVEAHIINFNKDILGKTIKVIFLERIRKEKKFSSLPLLRKAIQKDLCYITSKYSAPLSQPLQFLV